MIPCANGAPRSCVWIAPLPVGPVTLACADLGCADTARFPPNLLLRILPPLLLMRRRQGCCRLQHTKISAGSRRSPPLRPDAPWRTAIQPPPAAASPSSQSRSGSTPPSLVTTPAAQLASPSPLAGTSSARALLTSSPTKLRAVRPAGGRRTCSGWAARPDAASSWNQQHHPHRRGR